jgi:signal transduction histidine kinase
VDGFVRVSVLDQGPGIPPDELEAVFDKFVQSSKTKTGAGGTGLGLAICREIIAAHKGRIWAENRPGGGAVFSFEIPLCMATDTTDELLPVGADGNVAVEQ